MQEAPLRIQILSRVTDPGAAARPNEDRLAFGPRFGCVIDGATGLGDERLLTVGESDAGWLAGRAAEILAQDLSAAPVDLSQTIASLNSALRGELAAALARREAGPRAIGATADYALPTASFQLARVVWSEERGATRLETAGLGDCVLFALEPNGSFWRATGNARPPGVETEAARRALRSGAIDGADGFNRTPEALEALRRSRAAHNRPGAEIWTLGVEIEAGRHLMRQDRDAVEGALLLLATDGLANLVDLYAAYDGPGLLRAAAECGLATLIEELRTIEREQDPTGARFPRFKQSDDATGLLMRIVPAG